MCWEHTGAIEQGFLRRSRNGGEVIAPGASSYLAVQAMASQEIYPISFCMKIQAHYIILLLVYESPAVATLTPTLATSSGSKRRVHLSVWYSCFHRDAFGADAAFLLNASLPSFAMTGLTMSG